MPARQAGQPLRRQGRHPLGTGRRRKRQEAERRRVATVDMNFELTLRRACIADPNLGCIRAELIVERQRGDGGNDARSTRQVDSSIDPARIHDIDGEGGILGARAARGVPAGACRLEQQPDGVAA